MLGVQTTEPVDFVASAGQGLQCVVDGRAVLLGNRSWMRENGLPELSAQQESAVAALESKGNTVVLAALEPAARGSVVRGTAAESASAAESKAGKGAPAAAASFLLAGAFAVGDTLKPDAANVVRHLASQGKHVWMISGDNERTAAAIAAECGIEQARVVAGVKPAGKLEKVHTWPRGVQPAGAVAEPPRC